MSNATPKGLMPGAPPKVRALANKGNSGDNMIAHLTGGEAIIPREVLLANPQLASLIHNAFTKIGADPMKFVAGSPSQQINPKTGMPMFGFFSSFGGLLGTAAGVLLAPETGGLSLAAAGALGGALGGFAGNAIDGGSFKQDLTGGVVGGIGGYMGAGTLASGLDAVGNSAVDALGGVGTFGTGQTIGSLASSAYDSISSGLSGIGNSISSGVNSLTDGYLGTSAADQAAQAASTVPINGGSLMTPAGTAYGGTTAAQGVGAGSLSTVPSDLSPVASTTSASGGTINPDSLINGPASLNANTMGGNGLLTPAGQATQSVINPVGAALGNNVANAGATGMDPTLTSGLNNMSTMSALGPAASLASGGLQYLGTQNAISAEQQATAKQQAIEAPYVQAGNTALGQQANLVESPTAQLSYVQNNPMFNAMATQATNTLEANQAAQGKVGSGGTANALQNQLLQLGTGLVNNQVSNLNQISQIGGNAAANTGSGALNTGAGIASGQQAAGTNLGAGVMGATNSATSNYMNQINSSLALARLQQLQAQGGQYAPQTVQQ